MLYKDYQDTIQYWNTDEVATTTQFGKYIAVSGNTGAGKSSLINYIVNRGPQESLKIIGINERVLHHPLLKLMFSEPGRYSFSIQLNFVIQRHLILLRWLSLGYSVVIERSHLDDYLFVEVLHKMGHITSEEFLAYSNLCEVLYKKTPEPNIYLYLDIPPEISMERLSKCEQNGERPKEFPNDSVKFSFVSSWYARYQEFYAQLQKEKQTGIRLQNTIFLKRSAQTDTTILANEILTYLKTI